MTLHDSTNTKKVEELRPSQLFVASLIIGPASWLMPHQGAISTLLPQRIAEIAPDEKVSLVMMFSSVAMIVAFISNVVLGTCSDLTRSRFGKRKPWIICCSLLSCMVLFAFGYASTISSMLVLWCLYEMMVNGVAAAMIAQLSDRVPRKWRGTVSSAYGIGQMLGAQSGVLVAAQFLGNVRIGVSTLALVAAVGGVVSALMAGEQSNLHSQRVVLTRSQLIRMFAFPIQNARNFYKVLSGRFLMVIASGMANSYMLYLIQDYIGLSQRQTSRLLSINSTIILTAGFICCLATGSLIDRVGHIRRFTALTTIIIALGQLLPFIIPSQAGLIAYAVVLGVGNGANSVLIQTLSLLSLPNPANAAKDLGFLNLANTLGSVCASLTGAFIINHFGYAAVFPIGAAGTLLASLCFISVSTDGQ